MRSGSAYHRTPYLIVSRESRPSKEVYGAIDDHIVLQAQLLRPERPSPLAVVAMHPIGAPAYLPMFSGLARAGFHVIACSSRYSTGDHALIMEKVLLDLGACVRDARERLGYEQVVLAGWSGGGPLVSTYQAQAERPTIETLVSGEPCRLADAGLIAADGLFLMASHRSRHHLLTDWLDPSITDESRPDERVADLNLYSPVNPNQPPYDAGYLAVYRKEQQARNRRITAWVRDQLDRIRTGPNPDDDRAFVVHGTMADPRWLDPTVDPNDRRPGSCYLGDPRAVNDSPAGLGRFTTLRSWLSQWSVDDARADSLSAVESISVPMLLVANGADDACPASHTLALYEAAGRTGADYHVLPGADHYLSGPEQRSHVERAAEIFTAWVGASGLSIPQG